MTKQQEAQAIIYGSFILYAIDALLDKADRVKGTTIRLKQMIRAQTSKANNVEYVLMSNRAWANVVEDYSDKNYRIAIFDFVESLGFGVENIMTEMFGSKFIEAVGNFALKMTKDGCSKEVLKESREVTKALINATRKVVFDSKE